MIRTVFVLFSSLMFFALLNSCGDEEATVPVEPSVVGYWMMDGDGDRPGDIDASYLAILNDGTLCQQSVTLVYGEEACWSGTYTSSDTQCVFTYPLESEPWEINLTFDIVELTATTLCLLRPGPDAPAEPACWTRISPSQLLCDCP